MTVILLAALLTAADPVGAAAPWLLDELALTNGNTLRGLVLDDVPQGVRFQVVRQARGRPTVTLTLMLPRAEVASVKKIADADRVLLKDKLAALDPLGTSERTRMDALELKPTDWPGKANGARRYESDQFVLVSRASEDVTRRAAVRLEQITTAFVRFLPPRATPEKVTTVYLAGDTAEYHALAGPVLNPAVYDPVQCRILCGSQLRQLGDELTSHRLHHTQQLARLGRYEEEIRQLYKGSKPDLERFLKLVAEERDKVWRAERANDAAFNQTTRRLFAILYHEAFHSYAGKFVYPSLSPEDVRAGKGTGELPRWLNEGLAQIFETAVLEAGELRVGHADLERLTKVQALADGKPLAAGGAVGLVPVAELLRSGKDGFVAGHIGERAGADRMYLTAWAVAFYLTFDRGLVGSKAFDAYLVAINSGGNAVAAFEQLVGQDVPTFEAGLRSYLLRLTPDGTLRPK